MGVGQRGSRSDSYSEVLALCRTFSLRDARRNRMQQLLRHRRRQY